MWAILCLCTTLSFAQSKLITGKITDQQGQPVPFATVHVKGSKRAVSADADGSFAIKANPSEVLIITGAGIAEQDVPVGESSNLAVKVSRKSSNLTEVVVTALGSDQPERQVGYQSVDRKGTDGGAIRGSKPAEWLGQQGLGRAGGKFRRRSRWQHFYIDPAARVLSPVTFNLCLLSMAFRSPTMLSACLSAGHRSNRV